MTSERTETTHNDAGELPAIRRRHQQATLLGGILADALCGHGTLSGATALSLLTTDGLVSFLDFARDGMGSDPAASIWLAYQRWFQKGSNRAPDERLPIPKTWLDEERIMRTVAVAGMQESDPQSYAALLSTQMSTRSHPQQPTAESLEIIGYCYPVGLLPYVDPAQISALAEDVAAISRGPKVWPVASQACLLVHSALVAATHSVEDESKAFDTTTVEDPVLANLRQRAATMTTPAAFSAGVLETHALYGRSGAIFSAALAGARWGLDAVSGDLVEELQARPVVERLIRALDIG